jgi:hypothetical protein
MLEREEMNKSYCMGMQLGVMLNSMKRLLDTLRPNIDAQMKAWVACLPGEGGHGRVVFGERLNEVTVELRAKYKSFLQAIVEKLADNVLSIPSSYRVLVTNVVLLLGVVLGF